jgi:hypothetical protein
MTHTGASAPARLKRLRTALVRTDEATAQKQAVGPL